jgi:hypothetical protein
MKKFYITLFIILSFAAKISAQSSTFSFQNINNVLQGNAGFIPIEGSVEVVNISGSTKDVKMFRKINNLAPGQLSSFCWGINCYGPTTDTSTYIVSLSPSNWDTARCDLNPWGNAGYSEVTYCWYDVNNPSDSICLKFTYDITTGINELKNAPADFMSLPHPNPADRSTVLIYHMTNTDAESKILFYNVIGSKVLEIKLDNSKHDVELNTSAFQPGVYYYTFISGTKAISTNKLIVSHRN